MPKTIRVGFVGAGNIAKSHVEALKTVPDVEIVGVTDISRAAAESLAGPLEATVFETPAQMAADGGLDALYILLPPFAHGEAERAALDHGLPFFIEKPVGVDMGPVREIAREVELKGLLTAAGYMNRYRQGVAAARERLQQDPAILAYGGWWGGSPQSASWWTDKSKSGGQFLEQVTHTADLVRYLFGDAEEVFAYAANGFNPALPGYTMDDAATVSIKFANGGIATLMSSVTSNAGGGVFLNVHGLHTNVQFSGWEHSVRLIEEGQPAREIAGEGNIFDLEDAAFIQAVRSGDPGPIRSTYGDAVKTLALAVAANESIASGRPVAV